MWADVPDLAVIRVADTYYMSSTTMHLSPGLPIMKSQDLVNWQLVGYAYSTLGDNDALTLRNGKNAYGAGSWASSLRCHDGTFYATTFSSTTGNTHVYRTRDLENGPWAANSFRPALHDHSLFFDDDGRVYMIYGAGDLRLVELTADVSGIKRGGVDQVIIANASRVAGPNIGLAAEGSQMWKISGKYYLFNITWPRGGMRTVIVHRADAITGPYEGRVALQDKGVAQGGLIDTPQGDWYAYLFRDYGAVGRIPYLVPVKWEDGWPVLGVDGKVPDTLNLPAGKGLVPGIIASDEFSRRPGDPALPLAWQWNHNPDESNWSLVERPGFLRLTTGRVDGDFLSARNTLTQRMFGPECSGTVCIDVSNMQDGDFAGLGALQKRYGLVGVKMAGNAKSIVMVSAESGWAVEVDRVPLTHDIVYLKVECDFSNRADSARFFHSSDGQQWTAIGKPLRMMYTLPHFMGYRFALFNYAAKTAGGFVDFDYFRVGDKIIQERTHEPTRIPATQNGHASHRPSAVRAGCGLHSRVRRGRVRVEAAVAGRCEPLVAHRADQEGRTQSVCRVGRPGLHPAPLDDRLSRRPRRPQRHPPHLLRRRGDAAGRGAVAGLFRHDARQSVVPDQHAVLLGPGEERLQLLPADALRDVGTGRGRGAGKRPPRLLHGGLAPVSRRAIRRATAVVRAVAARVSHAAIRRRLPCAGRRWAGATRRFLLRPAADRQRGPLEPRRRGQHLPRWPWPSPVVSARDRRRGHVRHVLRGFNSRPGHASARQSAVLRTGGRRPGPAGQAHHRLPLVRP
jgi:beta-xylosidase